VKILLVGQSRIDRSALRHLLDQQDDLEVVADTDDPQNAVQLATSLQAEVALIDVDMPGIDCVDILMRIAAEVPGIKVVAMSSQTDPQWVYPILDAGASAYVLKRQQFDQLKQALDSVARDEIYVSEHVEDFERGTDDRSPGHGPTSRATLSTRERDVLRHLAEGRSSKQIASQMHLSVKTIESHRLHVTIKLGIRSVAALTKFAIREGLTTVED